MITEYKTIKSTHSLGDLDEMVNTEIQKGWQPWGGPAFSPSSNNTIYIQALVRNSVMENEWQKLNETQIGAI